MTVIKEYNNSTNQWETILVGKQGPQGESGIVESATAPTETDVLWLDTSEDGDAVIPVGGTTGQSLVKASNDDYDTTWERRVKSEDISEIVTLTQAEYDAIPSPSAATLYVITGA